MQNDVKSFMIAAGQTVYINNEDQHNLYLTLIDEEYNEFMEACKENDSVEALDACMDMIWVILGFCHSSGFNIEDAWKEVARSNLSKINKETGKVLKRPDGKVIKPSDWSPPNLTSYVLKKTLTDTK